MDKSLILLLTLVFHGWPLPMEGEAPGGTTRAQSVKKAALEFIKVGPGGTNFVGAATGKVFRPWGFNYDHDSDGALLEDYWEGEWSTVAEDFREMKALGANVVRIHLQLGKFMRSADRPNGEALARLGGLIKVAESNRVYLDVTGLGCYDKRAVPGWYDSLGESNRWQVQARFWEAVAGVCRESPAIFCYDLMNEPILPGESKAETDWLARPLGDKYFVQRISLDLEGRSRHQVARAWVDKLTLSIRKQDPKHLITVGVIPWALPFPGATPLFYSPEVGAHLDFVSVHFYPKRGEVDKALSALAVYEVGKPLVVEEIFTLHCGREELDRFIDGSRAHADGWMGFYWGKTIADYSGSDLSLAEAITRDWLEYFATKSREMNPSGAP